MFSELVRYMSGHSATLQRLLVALLAAAAQQIFQALSFRCPCLPGRNSAYAAVSIGVPALLLLLASWASGPRVWKLVTGCCVSRRHGSGPGLVFKLSQVVVSVSGRALVAPISWIAVALLNGSYYVCAESERVDTSRYALPPAARTREMLAQLPCVANASLPPALLHVRNDILRHLSTESQLLGWTVLGSAGLLGMLFMCFAHWVSPVSYHQLRFWRSYIDIEHKEFDRRAEERAHDLANTNVSIFFGPSPPPPPAAATPATAPEAAAQQSDAPPPPPCAPAPAEKEAEGYALPKKVDWDIVSGLYAYQLLDGEPLYSTLHAWAAKHAKDKTLSPWHLDQGSVRETLSFVDGREPRPEGPAPVARRPHSPEEAVVDELSKLLDE
uniref:Calcium homeostasis modulator protein 2-like n=1 Tax=Petromyzon marinus TaxID=7757 RepID=A0AAJ7TW49_PETMA|nr:calcium homeostasis modulator protein 2-like [Petromyzon marinus]